MAFTIGKAGATDSSGYSTYGGPLDPAYVYYVSSSGGNDNNNGTSWVANPTNTGGAGAPGPLATPEAGALKLNAAYAAGKTPWLLFREGDSWTGHILTDNLRAMGSGTVATPCDGVNNLYQPNLNPLVISSYHESVIVSGSYAQPNPSVAARPLFNMQYGPKWLTVDPTYVDKIVISGLEWYWYQRDPNNASYQGLNISGVYASMYFYSPSATLSFLLVEDCKDRFSDRMFGIQSDNSFHTGVIARRNIIIDNYQAGNPFDKRGTQGLDCDNGLFSVIENTFDMINWWPDTQPGNSVAGAKQVTLANDGNGNTQVAWPDKFGPQYINTVSGKGAASFLSFTNSNSLGSPAAAGSTTGSIMAGNSYRPDPNLSATYKNYIVNSAVGTGPYTFLISDGGIATLSIYAAGSGGTAGTYTNVSVGNGSTVDIVVNADGTVHAGGATVNQPGLYWTHGATMRPTGTGIPSGLILQVATLRNVPWNAANVTPQYAYWTDPRGNEYGHHLYWNNAIGSVIQGNTLSRNSSGSKNLNADLIDNLWIANGWGCMTNDLPAGHTFKWNYNVCTAFEDRDIFAGGGATLMQTLGQAGNNGANLDWANNIYSNANSLTNTDGYQVGSGAANGGTWNVSIHNEIVFSWGGSLAQLTQFVWGGTTYSSNNFDPTALNTFDATNRPNAPYVDPWRTVASYYSTIPGATANNTFTGVISGLASGSATLTVSGFSGTNLQIGDAITWSGQTSNVVITALGTGTGGNGTYTVRCGANQGSTSMSGWTNLQFLTQARALKKSNWSANYTANAVNNYIRAGFGIASYPNASHRGGKALGRF